MGINNYQAVIYLFNLFVSIMSTFKYHVNRLYLQISCQPVIFFWPVSRH